MFYGGNSLNPLWQYGREVRRTCRSYGEWYRDSDVTSLDNPYDVTTKYIHDSQRVVIEEVQGDYNEI